MILIPTTGADDWQRFLADPEKQWRRGYSAMAAALSWESADGLPAELAAVIGEDPELLLAIPEHKVWLPGGGRASQCDVFALVKSGGDLIAVAVEAKVKEPFGPTIGEWMRDASPGKLERISAICHVLGLSERPPDHLRYQLFHRTAAAVYEARRFNAGRAAMIVQSFSQEHLWFDDFRAFAQQFGMLEDLGEMLDCRLPCGMRLSLAWAVGAPEFL